jgi:ankyrin repeat protein
VAVSYKFNGANQDALNERFLECVAQKNVERAQHYLESGANIDVRDMNEDTALLHAVRKGDAPMALMLIKKRASLDLQDNEGATALILAAKLGIKAREQMDGGDSDRR